MCRQFMLMIALHGLDFILQSLAVMVLGIGEGMFAGLFAYAAEDFVGNGLRGDACEAVVIAAVAGFVAEYGAWAACHGELHGVGVLLLPSLESAVGVGSAPDAYDGRSDNRGEVHVGGVHRQHHVEMTEQCEFKREAMALVGERRDAGICLRPTAEDGTFVVATAEEEYFDSAGVGECLHYFFHQLGWVNFSLVLGEGCNSHPFLSLRLRCGDRCERGRIGFAVAEKRFEMLLHGESESVEYLAVAGALRNEGEHDLVGAPGQGALARALLVDARNGDAVKPGEEVDDHGADNAVEVGHGVEREVRLQFPVKSDKTSGSPILRRVEVDTAHPEVFGRVEEHCGHRGAGDH